MAIQTLRNEMVDVSPRWTRILGAFSADIKLAHSVFAMPFAVVGLVLSGAGWPSLYQAFFLLVAMVSARSFAMGMNRYLDADIDSLNERTVLRAIPAGRIHRHQSLAISLAAAAIFLAASFALSTMCGFMAIPLLMILAFYSQMKRIGWMTHFYLGLCLALAPVAVSIALTGSVPLATLLVAAAVTFWTAGFDILYSLQDRTFDQAHGLASIPARFGARNSLWISRLCFAAMMILLVSAGQISDAGIFWYAALIAVSALLFWEHWILRNTAEQVDGRLIDKAFFTANAWISVVFCAGVLVDRLASVWGTIP
jgi:4-hydroxybenzoate polyprenyltransferase